MNIENTIRSIVLASLLAPSIICAADAVVDPYAKAVDSYNAGKFEQCYKEFNELFGVKPDDSRVNFYLGRCATEMKLYDEAQLAFERVLMVEPNHVRSKLELGRLYFEQKQLEEASAQFDSVMESDAPEAVKAQVKQLLAAIEDSKKKTLHKWCIYCWAFT